MARQIRQPFTIKEVADRAGVSPATVSRVLNDSVSVREAKRAQVLAVINELGYRPSRVASNLRRRQVQMIGVVVSDIENPHFSQMVRAIEDTAYLKGYRVLLCNTDEDPVKQREYLGVMIAERVAGAIISPTEAGAAEISELIDIGASVVAFDRPVDDKRADAVLAANVTGARLGTDHLLAAGHRKIGFLGGPSGVRTAAERLSGYEQAMFDAGIKTRSAMGDFRVEGGRRGAQDLIDKGATALLVANNLMAIGALQAIRATHRRVPADVALASFDDPAWAELTDPPLTTLAQPVRLMAVAAVELLMQRLAQGRGRRKRQVFELELRHRGSCCPAPAPTLRAS
jgi:LacI family transcriptional regulator